MSSVSPERAETMRPKPALLRGVQAAMRLGQRAAWFGLTARRCSAPLRPRLAHPAGVW